MGMRILYLKKSAASFKKNLLPVLIMMLIITSPIPAYGEGPWLSGITVDGHTRPAPVYQNNPVTSVDKDGEGPTLIDITVTLTEKEGDPDYPRGDNDGTTQGNGESQEQDNYEIVFQYMADAIYEMTEGQHKLRNVRIFPQGNQKKNADILWDVSSSGHPAANVNGISAANRHIFMYDVFKEGKGSGSGASSDYRFIPDDLEGAGYTLAHEMGHYFYGLYDEYKIKPNDIPVKKSVMNSQWNALGTKPAAYDWLNFSVAHQSSDPQGDWVNTKVTEQHRNYGESAWETLSRNIKTDPKKGDLNGRLKRMYFADLAAVAPADANKPKRTLESEEMRNTARDSLNIIWMAQKGDVTYEIILDRSGSMSGTPLENAKTAAKILVNLAELSTTTIGIISFDDTVYTEYPLTLVADESIRQEMLAAIEAIYDSGATAIGDAAYEGLQQLLALGVSTDVKSVFLLSDGQSNSGRDPLSVIPDYQAAQIPIFSFAYSSGADVETMRELAYQTGGDVFITPTTLDEISAAFQRAFERATGVEGLSAQSNTAATNVTTITPVHVDATIGRLMVTIVHEGAQDSAEISFLDPDGAATPESSISETSGQTMRNYLVEMPTPGEWQIQIRPQANDLKYSYHITAAHVGTPITLSINAVNAKGAAVTYPEPLLVTASIARELLITGAMVVARVQPPSGESFDIQLLDDGMVPDELANDGIYSGVVPYDQNGAYNISAWAYDFEGNALLTREGLISAPRTDGSLPPAVEPVPLGMDFERHAQTQITVSNAQQDDHGNELDENATLSDASNEDIAGRIDYLGDIDCFYVEAASDGELFVRASNLFQMDPLVRVYSEAGDLLVEGDLESAAAETGYVRLAFSVKSGNKYFISVSDLQDNATGGLYAVSVGEKLNSDDISQPEGISVSSGAVDEAPDKTDAQTQKEEKKKSFLKCGHRHNLDGNAGDGLFLCIFILALAAVTIRKQRAGSH